MEVKKKRATQSYNWMNGDNMTSTDFHGDHF